MEETIEDKRKEGLRKRNTEKETLLKRKEEVIREYNEIEKLTR